VFVDVKHRRVQSLL